MKHFEVKCLIVAWLGASEKGKQCTAEKQEPCAQIQRGLKQIETVEAAEAVTISVFFQAAS